MTFNAYVTTDENHRLHSDSKVVILDPAKGLVSTPVPATAESGPLAGTILWSHRMGEALRAIGWQFAPRTELVEDTAAGLPGRGRVVRFNAVPKES